MQTPTTFDSIPSCDIEPIHTPRESNAYPLLGTLWVGAQDADYIAKHYEVEIRPAAALIRDRLLRLITDFVSENVASNEIDDILVG